MSKLNFYFFNRKGVLFMSEKDSTQLQDDKLSSVAGGYTFKSDDRGNQIVVATDADTRIFINRPTGEMAPVPPAPDGQGGVMAPVVVQEWYAVIRNPDGTWGGWQQLDYNNKPIGPPIPPDGLIMPQGPGAHIGKLY
jgi:hypothetical protein